MCDEFYLSFHNDLQHNRFTSEEKKTGANLVSTRVEIIDTGPVYTCLNQKDCHMFGSHERFNLLKIKKGRHISCKPNSQKGRHSITLETKKSRHNSGLYVSQKGRHRPGLHEKQNGRHRSGLHENRKGRHGPGLHESQRDNRRSGLYYSLQVSIRKLVVGWRKRLSPSI